MALTPETEKALSDALAAVIDECGDDPAYADLVDALSSAQDALPEKPDAEPEHAPEHEHDAPPADDKTDEPPADDKPDESKPPDNFDEAQRRFGKNQKARTSQNDDEAAA